MSTFREFVSGFELGQQQRKSMQRDKAVSEADSMFKSGNYEGAESALMAHDPQLAGAYGQAGERRKEAEKVKTYSQAFKAGSAAGGTKGGLTSVGQAAGELGDFDTAANIDEKMAGMNDRERKEAAGRAGFFADAAYGLSQIQDPAQRQAAFNELIQTNGPAFGITPEMAARFDLSDQNLKVTYESALSMKEKLEMKAQADKAPQTTLDGTMMWDPEQRKYVPIEGAVDQYRKLHPEKPGGSGSGGLTDYQEIQSQFKLDDVTREIEDKERTRKGTLSKLDQGIGLVNDFLDPSKRNRFNEVYGNWINPTGEKDDLFNPRVTPGSDRANGMAMLKQIGGQAFLDAIGQMKGTGSLSDAEGARVTQAATRLMDPTQSDEAALEAGKEFQAALVSYKKALEQDLATVRRNEEARRRQIESMIRPGQGGRGRQAPQAQPLTPDEQAELEALRAELGQR